LRTFKLVCQEQDLKFRKEKVQILLKWLAGYEMFSLHNATLSVVKMILETLKIVKIEIAGFAIKSDKEFWDLLFECKEV